MAAAARARYTLKENKALAQIAALDARIADWQADPGLGPAPTAMQWVNAGNNGPKRQTALNKINNRYNNKVMPLVQNLYKQWELLEDKRRAALVPVAALAVGVAVPAALAAAVAATQAKATAKLAKIRRLIPNGHGAVAYADPPYAGDPPALVAGYPAWRAVGARGAPHPDITTAVEAERDDKIITVTIADADRRVNAANVQKIELQAQHTRLGQEKAALGGSSRKQKKVRNHKGIVQTGGNKGKLRKGYKYTGKRLKNNMPEIKKVKAKK